jgi:hypothetical protein
VALTGRPRQTERYRVDPDTGCWEWLMARNKAGYGLAGVEGEYLAHRVAYKEKFGPVPEGHDLHHKCENKGCVNPEHLEPLRRGPHYRKGARTILTEEQVAEVRATPRTFGSGTALARKFGVHVSAIYHIRDGLNWKDAA